MKRIDVLLSSTPKKFNISETIFVLQRSVNNRVRTPKLLPCMFGTCIKHSVDWAVTACHLFPNVSILMSKINFKSVFQWCHLGNGSADLHAAYQDWHSPHDALTELWWKTMPIQLVCHLGTDLGPSKCNPACQQLGPQQPLCPEPISGSTMNAPWRRHPFCQRSRVECWHPHWPPRDAQPLHWWHHQPDGRHPRGRPRRPWTSSRSPCHRHLHSSKSSRGTNPLQKHGREG